MRNVAQEASALNGTYVAVEFSCESANVSGAKSWVASSGRTTSAAKPVA